jgi:hypothetical protein
LFSVYHGPCHENHLRFTTLQRGTGKLFVFLSITASWR